MKIVTIVGARPQFIKASAFSRVVAQTPGVTEVLVHTGQHFDDNMSEVFFREMDIPAPAYHLDIHSLSHGAMTGRMLEAIEKVLAEEKPDFTLVYGDTNSTLAGALAARKLHIKVAHVEAGLRSFNMAMPEEVNRILTDRISDYLFCPTKVAIQNLEQEGFRHFPCLVAECGDIMYDAALYYKSKSDRESKILADLSLSPGQYHLATIHRQENTDDKPRLQSIVEALNQLNRSEQVIVPIHPRTRKLLDLYEIIPEFRMIPPVGYLDMIALTSQANLILTDSGGLQKEAYFFGRYCVTLRDQTEWTELVDGGYNILAGADTGRITEAAGLLANKKPGFEAGLYGDGHAAEFILAKLQAGI